MVSNVVKTTSLETFTLNEHRMLIENDYNYLRIFNISNDGLFQFAALLVFGQLGVMSHFLSSKTTRCFKKQLFFLHQPFKKY